MLSSSEGSSERLTSQSEYQLAQSSSAPSTIPKYAMVGLASLVKKSADLFDGCHLPPCGGSPGRLGLGLQPVTRKVEAPGIDPQKTSAPNSDGGM